MATGLKQAGRFPGGVHPPEGKEQSSGGKIQIAPLQDKYVVPLRQNLGVPPKLAVSRKQQVGKGQLLAEPQGFVSAGVHAPTSGTVSAIVECSTPAGGLTEAVEITSDGEDKPAESLEPMPEWEKAEPRLLLERIQQAGLLGLGGAAFPTHVKLSPPPHKKIDTLIVNGVECEPCLTADHRLMLEESGKIIQGAAILGRVLGLDRVLIAIEENKPDAIECMGAAASVGGVEVVSLPVRYPQGAEKQLIYALTDRKVPTGGLPMDVGCVVQNVATCEAAARAVVEAEVLIERVVTVTGTPVANPGNWRHRMGTEIKTLLELAGGVKSETAKIIVGGPMMGMSVYSLDIPIAKSTSGLTLLAPEEIRHYTSEPCINCGMCVDVCPMNLVPGALSVQAENERYELAEAWNAMDCIECGCCAYTCPASRPMIQHLKRSKIEIMARRKQNS